LNERLIKNGIIIRDLHKEDNGLIKGEFELNNKIMRKNCSIRSVCEMIYNPSHEGKANDVYKDSFDA
jgi:hypothetical protein